MKVHRLALLILALHLVLGIAYSVIVPLWEAYDEWGHYHYIRYLAMARALPPKGGPIAPENDTTIGQPPLYYLLGAAATSWIDTSDWREPLRNRYSSDATAMGGYNRALHGYEEDFPWHGAVLAAHMARFVSVLLSTITVWFTYLIGRTLFSRRPEIALGAMAINAFWPQFLFIGGVINNDNLITTCAAVLLWFLVRNVAEPGRWRDRLGLVVSLGAAMAAKAIGLVFLPLVLLGLLTSWVLARSPRREHQAGRMRRRQALWAVLGVIAAAALALTLFGLVHPRYIAQIGQYLNPRVLGRLDASRLLSAARLMWGTLWASFGWQSVGIADWVYQVVQPVWLAACAGLVVFFARCRDAKIRLALAYLAAAVAIVAASIVYRALFNSYYFTGRYLLSTITAFSTLLAVGLAGLADLVEALWPRERSAPRRTAPRVFIGVVSAGMLAFAVYAPLAYIAPVYARPAKLPVSTLSGLQQPLHVNFDHALELAGYDLQPTVFHPGETVKVTLYWHCLQEVTANYSLAIKILGLDDAEVASLNTYPGRGNYPTFMWHKGDVFKDTYWLPVAGDAVAPTLARLKVAFFRAESGLPPLEQLKVAFDPTLLAHLPAYDPESRSLGFAAMFGRFKLAPAHSNQVAVGETPQHAVDYRLGDTIRLAGYDAPERVRRGQALSLTLHWQASGPTERPYTVFVHVVDSQDRVAAQADGQPLRGYYPTELWSAKESITDAHSVALPADLSTGRYRVVVGLYSLDTGQRLAVLDSQGRLMPDNQIPLETSIQVED